MISKKKIIIGAVAFFLLAFVLVLLIFKNKREEDNIFHAPYKTSRSLEEKIKINHPDLNAEQLAFYSNLANDGERTISECFGREDEKSCIAAVSFLKNDKELCYIHNHAGDHEEAEDIHYSVKQCVDEILMENPSGEISKCQPLNGEKFYNCVKNLFSIYEKREECKHLPEEAKNLCEDVFNYNVAFLNYNQALCDEVKTDELKQYCLKTIIDPSQDTDGDGLKDLEEINKYHTHYLFWDTDGDGISDSQEIMAGTNPLEKN